MRTLDAPVYEVKQDSEWYKSEKKRIEDTNTFFDIFKDKYGTSDGFAFYHAEFFGVYAGTEAYDIFKDEVVKNSTKEGFYAFKKRSKYFKEIKDLINRIEKVYVFKAHDELGSNNVTASQWVGDRWFYGAKDEQYVVGKDVNPIDYKDYLKLVTEALEAEEQQG